MRAVSRGHDPRVRTLDCHSRLAMHDNRRMETSRPDARPMAARKDLRNNRRMET